MNRNKIVLVLGATYNQVFLIKKLKEIGYKVWVTPKNSKLKELGVDKLLELDTSNKEELLTIVKENKINSVITSGSSTPIITVAYINEKLNLSSKVISYKTAKDATYKNKFREILKDQNILPNGFSNHSLNIILEKIKELRFPVIIKPSDTGGGKGVIKVEEFDIAKISNAFNNSIQFSKNKILIIEEYVNGMVFGVESIVINGEIHILAIPQKILNTLNNSVTEGVFFPSKELSKNREKIEKINEITIKSLNITSGPVHIDMIIDEQGSIYIIDIGARLAGGALTSSLIPQRLNYDLYKAVIDLSLGKTPLTPEKVTTKDIIFSSYFLVSSKKGKIKSIKINKNLIKNIDIIGYNILKEIGDKINMALNDSDRIALFYFKSSTEEDMHIKNNILKKAVEVEVE